MLADFNELEAASNLKDIQLPYLSDILQISHFITTSLVKNTLKDYSRRQRPHCISGGHCLPQDVFKMSPTSFLPKTVSAIISYNFGVLLFFMEEKKN